jgi:sigma-B regulation protein RsbU (phosphoserine phosphatase)
MITETTRILFAGESGKEYENIETLLREFPDKRYSLAWERSEEMVRDALINETYDVFLVSEVIGAQRGIDVAKQSRDEGSKKPVLIISMKWNKNLEASALKAGFGDYLAIESLSPTLLDHAISFSIQRARTREQLAHERDLLQTLLDNIPDTIYFKDRESRFTRINKAQQRVLGVKEMNGAIGKTDFDFFEHAREAYADEQRIIQTGEPLIDKQEKIKRADGEYRYVSATKVPIHTKSGEIVGTLGISRDITDRVKAEQELEVLKEHLEQAMQNIQEELEMARQIQKSLLPQDFPEMKGIAISAAYVPCNTIGGDLYEVIKLDDHRLGVLMFDVVGHGVPAALVAAMSKMIFGKHIGRGLGPRDLLMLVNEELSSQFHGKRYLAAFYGILDTENLTFVFSKGGHPPAMLVRPEEKSIQYLATEGIFIGLFPDGKYDEKTVQLRRGDKLVMFTDGLIETFNANDEYYGLKRLEEVLLETMTFPVDVMVSAVINSQKGFREKSHHVDDITLLVLQIK